MERHRTTIAIGAVLAAVVSAGTYAAPGYGPPSRPQGNGIPVSVVNTVDVRDADNPAFEPVQFVLGNINTTDQRFVTVPAGVRLVIEFVSSQGQTSAGCLPVSVELGTTVRGVSALHSLAVDHTVALLSGANSFSVTEPTRIYADPGTNVSFGSRLAPQEVAGECGILHSVTVSGHLVPLD